MNNFNTALTAILAAVILLCGCSNQPQEGTSDTRSAQEIMFDAGMRYIVITSKHHEEFAMFDSDACHRNGLGIGFYNSQFQDWTAPGECS